MPRTPRPLRKAAVDLWFTVQRMGRPDDGTFDDPSDLDTPDDGDSPSRVPKRPPPSSGSAGAGLDD